MKRIFEYFGPNMSDARGGYTFFSVIVWECALVRFDDPTTWGPMPARILEARFVIRGQLVHHVAQIASADMGGWERLLEYAKELAEWWKPMFKKACEFQEIK